MLGKSPSWQDADGACSGYLVQEDNFTLLVDCGNGVFGKLRRFVDYVDVDAVVISHLHADHFLDLIPYSYALTYAPRQQPVPVAGFPGTDSPAKPRLIVPSGAGEVFARVAGSWGNDDLIENAFHLEEYEGTEVLDAGPLRLRFHPVPHYITTHAIDVTVAATGKRFTFGADCRPNDELPRFALGTDFLLIEATLPRPERTGIRGHLTPGEAGEHGARANAKRLAITHISDELDHDWARSEAEKSFGGTVEVAHEGATYDI